jgi:predicted aminopeptidase
VKNCAFYAAWPRQFCAAGALAAALATTGCASVADVGYYWQAVSGHVQLMQAARPVADVLQDDQLSPPVGPRLSPQLRQQLELSQRIRSFAVTELRLPDNPSYRRYADLGRSAVTWNVVAAPALSLQLKTWCFPVTGCVSYRGYFSEAQARALADQLQAEGWEVSVYGVPAYSTLGKLDWLGGDPLLSTFINYPEGELARLIFHELAHQVAFAPGDTVFNESFATAVERLGAQRWLERASPQAAAQYALANTRKREFLDLTLATRQKLAKIYELNPAVAQDKRAVEAMKKIAFEEFRANYAALKARWGGYAGYDGWVQRANNASLGAQAAYDDLVPAFEALFARQGGDWPRFYDAVRQLAALSPEERSQRLKILKETPGG